MCTGNRGAGNVPWEMEVDHDDDLVHAKKVMIVEWGESSNEIKIREEWSLHEGGEILKIIQTSTGFRAGENTASRVYEKQ